jgi:peroxiredoxin
MFKKLSVIAISLSCLLGVSVGQKFEVKTLEIGATAPNFKLEDTKGQSFTLDSFKDAKYLMLIFTCNHCPDADAAWERIQNFATEYKSKGVEVAAIASANARGLMKWEHGYSPYGDSFEDMKLVVKDYNLTIPYLYDGDTQEVSKAYGAQATPHTFIFDAERKLVYNGQFDDGKRKKGPTAPTNTAKNAIDNLIAGKVIDQAVTRVYGCSTKWIWKEELVEKETASWKKQAVTLETIEAEALKELVKNNNGRVRMINVWSVSCAACLQQFPELTDTYRRFETRPFDFISISTDAKDDNAKVLEKLKEMHAAFPPKAEKVLKAQNRTTHNFHFQGELDKLVAALDAKWDGSKPYTVVIAPNGEITFRHTGTIDPVTIRKEILKVISEE